MFLAWQSWIVNKHALTWCWNWKNRFGTAQCVSHFHSMHVFVLWLWTRKPATVLNMLWCRLFKFLSRVLPSWDVSSWWLQERPWLLLRAAEDIQAGEELMDSFSLQIGAPPSTNTFYANSFGLSFSAVANLGKQKKCKIYVQCVIIGVRADFTRRTLQCTRMRGSPETSRRCNISSLHYLWQVSGVE